MTEDTKTLRDEFVLVPVELVTFLLGEGPMDGLWFGEVKRIRGTKRTYWWREKLSAALMAERAKSSPALNEGGEG